jgi:hypothetical protein
MVFDMRLRVTFLRRKTVSLPIIIYFHSSQCRLIPYLHQRPILFKATSIHSSIVAILELIRGAQCLIEVIRSSGEEMWRVDHMYGISRHCDEWKYNIIGRIFVSEIILIPLSLKISESSSNGSYREAGSPEVCRLVKDHVQNIKGRQFLKTWMI